MSHQQLCAGATAATSWLRALHNATSDLQILDAEAGCLQIAVSTAVARNPPHPLGGVDHGPILCHDGREPVPTVVVASNLNVNVVAIGRVGGLHVYDTSGQASRPTMAALVSSRRIFVPSGSLEATSIVLSEIDFGASSGGTGVAVAADSTIWLAGVGHVEVVVDVAVSIGQVHVPFDGAPPKVEACFGADAALPLNVPAICKPRYCAWWALHFLLEVLCCVWTILRSWSRSWSGAGAGGGAWAVAAAPEATAAVVVTTSAW